MPQPGSLRAQFLLDPDVVFLNHGSFGACPQPVLEACQRWQTEMERQPVEFLARRLTGLLAEARAKLAEYVGASADEVLYFPNPTTAVNMVARSLALEPGDEILSTDHEYGAMDRTWRFMCRKTGARYVRRPLPLPVTTPEELAETFWAGVTGRTRVVFLSHITSPTALVFPVQEICRRARAAGILSIVDGAHAVGQVPLNLEALGADLYTGACHKWLCAPKGAGFLYARREVQARLEPLVVSWGWGDEVIAPDPTMGETEFVRFHQWQGTRDVSAFLATPAAIQFQRDHQWETVRAECHALVSEARRRLNDLTGLAPLSPDAPGWFVQMASVHLPPVEVDALKRRLYAEHRIEVPVFTWNDWPLMRVSVQAYNSPGDVDRLAAAMAALLPDVRR